MATPRFASVDDYLSSLDPVAAETVRTVIDTILTEFPQTDSVIAWNVPQIKLGKQYLFGAFVAKKHISLNPWSAEVLESFRPRLEPAYVVLQSVFQVPLDWTVDKDLLTDLVRARLAELGEG